MINLLGNKFLRNMGIRYNIELYICPASVWFIIIFRLAFLR